MNRPTVDEAVEHVRTCFSCYLATVGVDPAHGFLLVKIAFQLAGGKPPSWADLLAVQTVFRETLAVPASPDVAEAATR